jgi:arylsulfatase A-like enzyme
MLWCHLAGLGTIWDAPSSYRRAYLDEGDPLPPDGAEVPEFTLSEDHDPDKLLGIMYSYAGQVSLFDSCMEAFLDFLEDSPIGKKILLAFTSSRGFPLGEHLNVGACGKALHEELVHVPMMLRFPDELGAAARSQALVEPADLWATLIRWFNGDASLSSPTGADLTPLIKQEISCIRDRLCLAGEDGMRAIRTPAWYLSHGKEETELYVKPDDRWEVNNVSNRCMEVVECLQDAIVQYEIAIVEGTATDLPALNDVLIHGLG